MITAEQVTALSELKGISLMEAKIQLDKLAMMQHINQASTVKQLKPILLKMVDMLK